MAITPSLAASTAILEVPKKTLYIGNSTLCKMIASFSEIFEQRIAAKKPLSERLVVQIDPGFAAIGGAEKEKEFFGRDLRLILPDGTHLIPKPIIDHEDLEFYFKSLLPKGMGATISSSEHQGYGHGLTDDMQRLAISQASSLGVPLKMAKTSIEGGNCLLLDKPDGSKAALVGVSSQIITLANLDFAGGFNSVLAEIETEMAKIHVVPPHFYRLAKNRLKVQEIKLLKQAFDKAESAEKKAEIAVSIIEKYDSEEAILASFLEEPKDEDYPALLNEAKKLFVMLDIVHEMIAADLGLDKKDVIFLDQERYHLDFEVLIGCDGTIFLHDEHLAIDVLEQALKEQELNEDVIEDLTQYLKYAKAVKDHNKIKNCANKALLEALGFSVKLIPGVYAKDPFSPCIDFMNGITLFKKDKPTLLTFGSHIDALNQAFFSAIDSGDPKKPHFHHAFALAHEVSMKLLAKTGAGLHCYSWEN